MATKKKKSKPLVTQTRCTTYAQKEIKALSERLFKKYGKEHAKLGIKTASSKVAVDALLYWSASAGMLNGKSLNDKNNIFINLLAEAGEI